MEKKKKKKINKRTPENYNGSVKRHSTISFSKKKEKQNPYEKKAIKFVSENKKIKNTFFLNRKRNYVKRDC